MNQDEIRTDRQKLLAAALLTGVTTSVAPGAAPAARAGEAADGVLDFDARYLLRTDDDVVIYMQNRGYRWGPPEVMAALSRRENVDPSAYYMRTAPKFDVPEGRYAWMSRHVFVGVAEKTPQGNSINYFMIV